MPRLPGAAMALLLAAAVDAAEIYRCLGDAGEVLFQATACSGGHALNPAPLNSLGGELRPGERALLERAAQAAPARAKARRNGPAGAERRRAAERCLAKRQQRDRLAARLRRGYKPAEGERLRRRRDDYEEYLRAFCD
jgi:hypothetical protein